MALSILNNISALTAQNQLSTTQANLQKTLSQLSSGLKINSGADDAAGLSIANGLQANIAALTQSQQNASNAIGMLQTADGALSQVTALLNRAVTLATEAANSTLNGSGGSQATALNTEFQNILTTINTIGSKTNFNGAAVFGSSLSVAMSDGTTGGNMTITPSISALSTTSLSLANTGVGTLTGTAKPANGDTVTVGGTTYTFVTGALTQTTANQVAVGSDLASSLANLAAAINRTGNAGTQYSNATNANAQAMVTAQDGTSLTISNQTGGAIAFTTTGTSTLQPANGTGAGNTIASGTMNLSSNANAAAALTALTSAISTVAANRGTIGATINQLQANSNVMNTQVQNLSSAQNAVMNADIGKTVAEMTQYNILQSTGMSALQQANQSQQSVLKLLQ